MTDRLVPHQTLGRYQLLVAVARGGMGQVWLGRLQGARGYSKLVAIKTLLPDEQEAGRLERMLLEEARIASMIQHANVVHTIELGEHEGVLYLVMEWVDGESLGFLVNRAAERGGVPMTIATALVSQVLAGLHAAHELADQTGPLGVVHRDVSPHNILVTYDGVAKLLDFGIAKATHQTSGNTVTGEVKGKFSYMAPEQILGDQVDRRCDVFAAGIILYSLTTGKHPFKHHNTAAVIHSITTDEPVAPPSTLVADYPSELEQVVLKALEKDIAKRWSSAEEMRVALERALPEAFDDAARNQLREFMLRMVSDRQVARREAVRRAQLAADARDVDTDARQALPAPSAQSASSLRAISITQSTPGDLVELTIEPPGESTQQAPARRRRAKGPWIAASLGLLLVGAVMVPRLLQYRGASVDASLQGSPPQSAAAAQPVSTPPSEAAAVDSPATPAPAAADSEAAAAAASSEATPVAAASASARPRKQAIAPKRKPAAPAQQPAPPSGREDLLAPDYAR